MLYAQLSPQIPSNEDSGQTRRPQTRTDTWTDSLEGDTDFIWLELERDLGGLPGRAGDPPCPPCHHEGFPLLVLQHLTLIQDLHALLSNLSAAAVELVPIQNAQLHNTTRICWEFIEVKTQPGLAKG